MKQNSSGGRLKRTDATFSNSVLPMTAHTTECELLRLGITRCTEQLGSVDTIIGTDTTYGNSMTPAERLEGLLGL